MMFDGVTCDWTFNHIEERVAEDKRLAKFTFEVYGTPNGEVYAIISSENGERFFTRPEFKRRVTQYGPARGVIDVVLKTTRSFSTRELV